MKAWEEIYSKAPDHLKDDIIRIRHICKAQFSITLTGLSVRVEALYNENGQMGVWVYDVPGGTFVPVEVLSTDGSIAMIQPMVEGALQLGQTVLIK